MCCSVIRNKKQNKKYFFKPFRLLYFVTRRDRGRRQGHEQLLRFAARQSAEDVHDRTFSDSRRFPGRLSGRRIFRRHSRHRA